MLCTDCKSRIHSSVVFDIMPRLPQLPIFEGKFIKPFNSLFRSSGHPDRMNASKVGISAVLHSTDVFRFELNSSTLMFGPTDPMATLWGISAWLHDLGTSMVSRFDFFHLADVYRCDLDAATSTAGPMDSVSMVWIVYGWLHGSRASQVSPFTVFPPFVIQTLNLELYSFDLHPAALTPESNDSIGMFQVNYGWLRCAGASTVSCFVLLCCIDLYRYELDSSALTAGPDKSIWTICMADG